MRKKFINPRFNPGFRRPMDEIVSVKETAEKKTEPYIKSVYPVRHHHAELIVRIPLLTALYEDDGDRTIEVQDKFFELFDFYKENTSVDLKRDFPLMEANHEIIEFNELCGFEFTFK